MAQANHPHSSAQTPSDFPTHDAIFVASRCIHDPEQLRLVLETIACKSATLVDLLSRMESELHGVIAEAAFSHAQLIGLLADTALGDIVKGDALDWACGPNFRGAPGQEASHA